MPTLVYSSGFIACVYTPNSIFLPAWSCLVCECVCARARMCTCMHVHVCFLLFCLLFSVAYTTIVFSLFENNLFSNSIFDFTFPVHPSTASSSSPSNQLHTFSFFLPFTKKKTGKQRKPMKNLNWKLKYI